MTATLAGPRTLPAEEIFARALAGQPCWVRDARGRRVELPVRRWLGGPCATEDERAADDALLDHCTGATVDLGCGPGRLTAALAGRGIAALGVDSCALAVRLTLARGGLALHRDLFAPLPGEGRWAHVLLADGNIGIGGDPTRLLARASQLLAPGGTVVCEVAARGSLVVERLRLETEDRRSPGFPWARVGVDHLGGPAAPPGSGCGGVSACAGRATVVLTRESR